MTLAEFNESYGLRLKIVVDDCLLLLVNSRAKTKEEMVYESIEIFGTLEPQSNTLLASIVKNNNIDMNMVLPNTTPLSITMGQMINANVIVQFHKELDRFQEISKLLISTRFPQPMESTNE